MTTNAFTPGPWSVKYNEQDEFKAYEVVGPGKNEWVCLCGYGGNAEACARLISAAPQMLALLNEIYDEFDNRYDGAEDSRTKWIGEYLNKMVEVIRKTEGRP